MRFISINIETTGLDPEYCQILQIGAVIEDTLNVVPVDQLPKFKCIVEHAKYTGQAFALDMNQPILSILAKLQTSNKEDRLAIRSEYNILPESLVAQSFSMWLNSNGLGPVNETVSQISITVAGKNFATFDKLFLEKLSGWTNKIQIRQRIIDPSILLMDWQMDKSLPNLQTCMDRCKLTRKVAHEALQDALDVVRVIRTATNDYSSTGQI